MTTILDARAFGHCPPDQTLPQEYLDKCHRVEIPGEYPFYQVESEHYAENGLIYRVSALRGSNGHFYPTCTCPAGMEGIPCKHRRWAQAHAQQFKQLKKIGEDLEAVDRSVWQGKTCYIVQEDEQYYAVSLSRSEGDYCYLCASEQCPHVCVARQFEQQFHREVATYNAA